MGKVVMPKNSALLNEIEAVLKIYYEENEWLSNDVYKTKLKELIGDDQYSSSYTKKSQITSYFGFTKWKDINNARSLRKITELGKLFYEALLRNDEEKIQELLMYSLEHTNFGRNNYGCPDSNSDIEPPILFIRSIIELEYLTYKEFAYILWNLENRTANLTDIFNEVRTFRKENKNILLNEAAIRYTDCKPIMILVRWGFLGELEDDTNVKKIIISPKVYNKYKDKLINLKIFNFDKSIDKIRLQTICENPSLIGYNKIFYGIPGCGKSYHVEHKVLENVDKQNDVFRTTFYLDYSNSDFIGQIYPHVEVNDKGEKIVTYKNVPGPFTKALKRAFEAPNEMIYLVIEEINRGNAAAIFGDTFQLLDRLQASYDGRIPGDSEYPISNEFIESCLGDLVKKGQVFIPHNLTILATMNTSDQNVFPLDTAFKRRWDLEKVVNDWSTCDLAKLCIPFTDITWENFAKTINVRMIQANESGEVIINEDKKLGAYFVTKDMLVEKDKRHDDTPENRTRLKKFLTNVVDYLFNDVTKFDHTALFKEKVTFDDIYNQVLEYELTEHDIDVFHNIFKEKVEPDVKDDE